MTQPIGVVEGTFAGTDPHAVYELELSEIGSPHIPALAELPDVGPHATGLGTLVANISLPFELRVYGWQLQRGDRISSTDQHRATAHRDSIIQALVDVAQDDEVPEVSVRLPGPVTTMIEGMLPSGQRILRDPGARYDVAAAWADAVETLTSRISNVIGAHTTVFVHEPQAEQAVKGRIRSVSGVDLERALDVNEVRTMWQQAASTDANVLIDTSAELSAIAAEVASVAMTLPVERTHQAERTWELIDTLVSAAKPVALYLPRSDDPKRFAEAFIQQYLDWGLPPEGIGYLRLTSRFTRGSEQTVGPGLEWLRIMAEHTPGYLSTL